MIIAEEITPLVMVIYAVNSSAGLLVRLRMMRLCPPTSEARFFGRRDPNTYSYERDTWAAPHFMDSDVW